MSGSAGVAVEQGGQKRTVAEGLLGYVLPRQHPKLAASGRDLSAEPDERAN